MNVFDGAGSSSFGDSFAGNVEMFVVDNSSSSHINNREKIFLVLSEGANDDINDRVGTTEKKISNDFTKANTTFSLSLHYNSDKIYLHVNKTENCKFKTYDKTPWYEFCLGSVSRDCTKDEMSEISLNGISLNSL